MVSRLLAKIRFRWGIASILTLGTVLVIVLLMAVTTLLDMRRVRAIFREELEGRGLLLTGTVGDVVFHHLYFTDIDVLTDIAAVVSSEPEVVYVQIFKPDGRLLVDTTQGSYPSGSVGEEFAAMTVTREQASVQLVGDILEVAAPVEAGGVVLGGVRIGFGTDAINAEVRAIAFRRVWQAVVLVLAAVAVSHLLGQYFAQPIRRLVQATQRVAEGRV